MVKYIIAALFALASNVQASSTPRMGLLLVPDGTANWGTFLRSNWTIADSSSAILGQPNGFTSSNTFIGGNVGVSTNTLPALLTIGSTVAPTGYSLAVSSQNSSYILVVQGNGNVGLGTGTPAALLHVSSGTILIDGNAATAFKIGTSSFTINSNGNIGLGTAPTGAIFAVSGGSVTISGSNAALGITTSNLTVVISSNGFVGSTGGSAPTFSGCGTTPTITSGSNDMRGSLVMTTGLSNTCTMTPATPIPSNYFCTFACLDPLAATACGQSAALSVACYGAAGLTTCTAGDFVSWTCSGTN